MMPKGRFVANQRKREVLVLVIWCLKPMLKVAMAFSFVTLFPLELVICSISSNLYHYARFKPLVAFLYG
jgi:hypothetical protein